MCIPRYSTTNCMGGTPTKPRGHKAGTSRCSRRGSRSNCTQWSRISATTRSLMKTMKPDPRWGPRWYMKLEIRRRKTQGLECVNFVPTPRASRWHHVTKGPRHRHIQVAEDAPVVADGYRWFQV